VGQSIVQGAKVAGPWAVVAVDQHENRLRLPRGLGAADTVDARAGTYEEATHDILGPEGADACVDCTGQAQVIEMAIRLTGPQGRTVLVGVPAHDEEVRLHTLQFHFGKRLIGSHGGASQPAADIPRLIRLFKAGQLDLPKLV